MLYYLILNFTKIKLLELFKRGISLEISLSLKNINIF